MKKGVLTKLAWWGFFILTGLVVSGVFLSEYVDFYGNSFLIHLFGYCFGAWSFILLVLSLRILIYGSERQTAFLKITQVEVRDELEEKAFLEAMKDTFILGLLLCSLTLVLIPIT